MSTQSKLSFGQKRPPLGELSGNAAKRPALPKSQSAPALSTSSKASAAEPKPEKASKTLLELREVTKEAAAAAVARLVNGYTDKSGSGYGPATTNSKGCILCQKAPNRDAKGYIQIAPISTNTRAGTSNGAVSAKPQPQGGHRLVIIATKSDEDIHNLLYEGYHASHTCWETICLNEEHLGVETKEQNEKRKAHAGRVRIITVIEGKQYVLEPELVCDCPTPCLVATEYRVAVPM